MLHVYAICPWSAIVSIHLHIYIIISQQKQVWIILKGCYFFILYLLHIDPQLGKLQVIGFWGRGWVT